MSQPFDLRTTYVSLATYRKSGKPVPTPVWIAPASGGNASHVGYVFSAQNAGKIKRLRNNAKVALAACDVRGKLLHPAPVEEWQSGEALIVNDPQSIQLALQALRAKYGWQMWLADAGSKLTGKYNKRAYIQVTLTPSEPT